MKERLKSRVLDEKDKKILMVLQEDGRAQLTVIARKVGLSIDSVHKRIKEMKRKGIFETGIFIEPRAIGYPLLMDVKVKLKNVSENERNSLIDYLMKHKNVVELLAVMGDYDFTCVLIAKDSNDLATESDVE